MKQDFSPYSYNSHHSSTLSTDTEYYYDSTNSIDTPLRSGDSPISLHNQEIDKSLISPYIGASAAISLLIKENADSKKSFNKTTLCNFLHFLYIEYSKPFHHYILRLIEDEKVEVVEEWLKYIPNLQLSLIDYLHFFIANNQIHKLNAFDHIFKIGNTRLISKFLYSNKQIISNYLDLIEYNKLLINEHSIMLNWQSICPLENCTTQSTPESFSAAALNYHANLDTLLLEKRQNSKLRWPNIFELALLANDNIFNHYLALYKASLDLEEGATSLQRKNVISKCIKDDKRLSSSEHKKKLCSIIADNINHPIIVEIAPWAFKKSKEVKLGVLKSLGNTIVKNPEIFMEFMNQDAINVSLLPCFQDSFIYHSLLGRNFGIYYIESSRAIVSNHSIKFQNTALALSNMVFTNNISNLFSRYSDCIWPNMVLTTFKTSIPELANIKKFAIMYTVALHPLNNDHRSFKNNYTFILESAMHSSGVDYSQYHLFRQYHKHYKARYDSKHDSLFSEYIHDLFSCIYQFLHKRFHFIELEQFSEFGQLLESQHNDELYAHPDFKWKFTSILGKRLHHLELVQSRTQNRARGISNYSPRFVHTCGEENKIKILLHKSLEDVTSYINSQNKFLQQHHK